MLALRNDLQVVGGFPCRLVLGPDPLDILAYIHIDEGVTDEKRGLPTLATAKTRRRAVTTSHTVMILIQLLVLRF